MARLKCSEGRTRRHYDQILAFAQFKEEQQAMPSSAAMMAHAVGHRCNTSTEHGPDEVSANGRAHKTTMSSPAYTPDTGQSRAVNMKIIQE